MSDKPAAPDAPKLELVLTQQAEPRRNGIGIREIATLVTPTGARQAYAGPWRQLVPVRDGE